MNKRIFRTAKEAWTDLGGANPKLHPGAEPMFYAGIMTACLILANHSSGDLAMEEAIINLSDEVRAILSLRRRNIQ
jgi:hypothetical protein